MARTNRREVLSDGEVQVVHCINRCVRGIIKGGWNLCLHGGLSKVAGTFVYRNLCLQEPLFTLSRPV